MVCPKLKKWFGHVSAVIIRRFSSLRQFFARDLVNFEKPIRDLATHADQDWYIYGTCLRHGVWLFILGWKGLQYFAVTSSLRSHTQSKLLNIATHAFRRNSRLLPLTFVCYSLLSEKPVHPVLYLFFLLPVVPRKAVAEVSKKGNL